MGFDNDRQPRRLYKYRTPNDRDIDDLLEKSRLYFPTPSRLNDPFDCSPRLLEPTLDQVNRWVQATQRRRVGRMTRPERTKHVKEVRRRILRPGGLERNYREVVDSFGIYSLAASPENVLMWSLYAEKHEGFVVELNVDRLGPPIGPPLEVQYVASRPAVNPLRLRDYDPSKATQLCFLRKSLPWEYEEEWRLFMQRELGGGDRYYPFPQDMLTAVYLGARAAPDTCAQIFELAARRSPQPAVWRMELNKTTYGLKKTRVKSRSALS